MSRQEIRLQGLGGQGIITAGHLIGAAASLHDHKHAIMTEDYSPYVTGGWSRADLVISDDNIDYPLVTSPNVLVAMSQDGLDDNWKVTPVKATVIAEAGIVKAEAVTDRAVYAIPALRIAEELGNKVVANIVMLGFLTGKTRLVSCEAMEEAIVNRYPKAAELNRKAFERGSSLASEEDQA
jgi:2-oxoglutarate ferredoxin oxidoreductase subunit gamma